MQEKSRSRQSFISNYTLIFFQEHLNRILITVESHEAEIISSYLRATYPLHQAWKLMMMSVIFMSLSSSRWARTPALKNTLLWPIRYRLGSSSRLLIWQQRKRTDQLHSRAAGYCWSWLEFWRQAYHEHTGLLSIHEAFGDGVGSEDFIPCGKMFDQISFFLNTRMRARLSVKSVILLPLSELLEDDAIREALSADTDPLQDTIAPQLIKN